MVNVIQLVWVKKKKYNKNLVNIKGTPKIDNILYGTNMVEVSI